MNEYQRGRRAREQALIRAVQAAGLEPMEEM